MDLEVDSLVAGEEGSAKFGTVLDGFAICASRECLFFIILLFTLETAIFLLIHGRIRSLAKSALSIIEPTTTRFFLCMRNCICEMGGVCNYGSGKPISVLLVTTVPSNVKFPRLPTIGLVSSTAERVVAFDLLIRQFCNSAVNCLG